MSYLKDFQTRITRHDYPAFLQLWEEYCNADEVDAKELCQILNAVKNSDLMQPFGRHVDKILPLWQKLTSEDEAYEVLKHILDIHSVNSTQLADLAYEMLQKRFGADKNFQDKIRLVGLRTKDKIQGSISNFELLSHMQKGNFVYHKGGWGVGEIMDVSFLREQLSIEFEHTGGRKDLSFATAFKTLVPIPKDHFLAMRFGSPEVLEKQFKEHPVESIKKLLKDLGPKTAAEIKEELCDLVIPSEQWSKWWQLTRSKVKKDSMIEAPEDLKECFMLRSEEFSSSDRFKKMIDNAKSPSETLQAIYTSFRDFGDLSKNEEMLQMAFEKLSSLLTSSNLTHAEELEILLLLQELGSDKDASLLADLVKRHDQPEELLKNMHILALKKRYLQEIFKRREDWPKLFQSLLLSLDYNPLRDYIITELNKKEYADFLTQALEELISHPHKSPEAFLWLFGKVMGGTPLMSKSPLSHSRLLESLLILLSRVEAEPDQKSAAKKIHALLSHDRYAIVRGIMQKASIEEVREFLLLATKCHSLSDHEIKIFHSLAEVAHPALAKTSKKSAQAEDTHTIWCTPEGYSQLQKRLQQIATVETVENAKEIEVARGHGDLRENAEFKAALERRDRLQSEMKTLSDQLAKSRILTKEEVDISQAGVGTEVECLTPSGKRVTYVLLGPWDANPDKNILSMQSKLAQTIKGLAKGDSFKFQDEEYKIVDIRNYFEK